MEPMGSALLVFRPGHGSCTLAVDRKLQLGNEHFHPGGPEMSTATTDRMKQTEAQQHSEGTVARAIEQQTAKLPSDVFLWAAGASIAGSLVLKMMEKNHEALFVGQWAPTCLLLGVYNKLVKVAGSDRLTNK
jgi:hypothetical protein